MFIGYQNDKIKFYSKTPLDKELFHLDKVEETDKVYIACGDEYLQKGSKKCNSYTKKKRKEEILNLLKEIDLKSIRAIRANDKDYIEKYESQAKKLREELQKL